MVVDAIEAAGYRAGRDCYVAVDVAANELLHDGSYHLAKEGAALSTGELTEYYARWAADFPLISIEDGLAEDDWDGWDGLTRRVGAQVQILGDDLYATSSQRMEQGIGRKASNAILVKPNQTGTLTEALRVIQRAKEAGWGTVVSHRSGETEDTTIADLAVATGAGQIKTGAPTRSERVAKYNRLLRIEEELGSEAKYAGLEAFSHLPAHRCFSLRGSSLSDTESLRMQSGESRGFPSGGGLGDVPPDKTCLTVDGRENQQRVVD